MTSNRARQSLVIVTSLAVGIAVGLAIQPVRPVEAAAAAPAASPPNATGAPREIAALQQRIIAGEQAVQQARLELESILARRITARANDQGLTPKQAVAFDRAYAEALLRVNRAQRELEAMRQRLVAMIQSAPAAPTPSVGTGQDLATEFTQFKKTVTTRLSDIERRLTELEMAAPAR